MEVLLLVRFVDAEKFPKSLISPLVYRSRVDGGEGGLLAEGNSDGGFSAEVILTCNFSGILPNSDGGGPPFRRVYLFLGYGVSLDLSGDCRRNSDPNGARIFNSVRAKPPVWLETVQIETTAIILPIAVGIGALH